MQVDLDRVDHLFSAAKRPSAETAPFTAVLGVQVFLLNVHLPATGPNGAHIDAEPKR